LEEECPPAEVLAAFVEGKISGQELVELDAHFIYCARCRELIRKVIETKEHAQPPNTDEGGNE
jgi:hypothetical protein